MSNQHETRQKYVYYGYDRVSEEEKPQKIRKHFEDVAPVYNKMANIVSFGRMPLWRKALVNQLDPTHGIQLLDIAGGSGDIAFNVLEYLEKKPNSSNVPSKVIVCDINTTMMDIGKEKAEQLGYASTIEWLLADAENLPLEDGCVDACTISFGLRNITHPEKVLAEAYRVVKPGGRLLCLETGHVPNPILRFGYTVYRSIIPLMGKIIVGQYNHYRYFAGSVLTFPNQEKLKKMIEDSGFSNVTYENMTFGVVSIHTGVKL